MKKQLIILSIGAFLIIIISYAIASYKCTEFKTPKTIKCIACHGTGQVYKKLCCYCEGRGQIGLKKCIYCEGRGFKTKQCYICKGKGEIKY